MKKSILLAFAALVLAAVGCTKDAPLESVSFETSIPVVTEGVASINVISSYTGAEAVTVPIKFGGTAVKGTDYSVSVESFVLGGAQPVKTIQITPLVFGSKKTVIMNLEAPEGFMTGNYPMVQFTLAEKLGYVSFSQKADGMTDQLDVELAMFDEKGAAKSVETTTEIAVEVDKEKSTAVEGVNFEFVGGAKAVFKAGESKAKVGVKLLKYEEGKNMIVLNIAENPKFSDGQYITTQVKLLGGIESLIGGEWKVKSFSPDKQYLVDMMMGEMEKLEGYPVFNAEDSFVIDPVENTFKPAFKSEIKNYFIGESTFERLDESWYPLQRKSETERTHEMNFGNGWISVDRYMFANINRDFSAKSTSEDKKGVVGFNIQENADKTVTLNLIIMDFVPKNTFVHPMFEWGGCGPEKGRKDGEKPVAHLGGVAVVLECVRK